MKKFPTLPLLLLWLALTGLGQQAASVQLTLPGEKDSIKFLAVGDTGTGGEQQRELAIVMADYRKVFPFDFVILTGDNMYGSEKPEDFKRKFEEPYRELLGAGVKFYASLGNHDDPDQRFYKLFNMNGEEYYRFVKGEVAFYALNTTRMDARQIKWMSDELRKDRSDWKIAFMHHPPYSSGGRHGSSEKVRENVEPYFINYGVEVVFSGHEHFYERIKSQHGVTYFITGAGGKLRKGDVQEDSPLTAEAFDADMSFMLVEIAKDKMHFQVISRSGETVDSGSITRRHR